MSELFANLRSMSILVMLTGANSMTLSVQGYMNNAVMNVDVTVTVGDVE